MKKKPEHATDLFRQAVDGVTPLKPSDRIAPHKPPRSAIVRQPETTLAVADTLSDFGAGNVPEEYLGNGLSRMVLRKLKRGNFPVEDTLDLHGLTSETARKLLQEFLHAAMERNFRCVLVIHGKGLNSEGGESVLRKLTRHWLTQHPRVLAYCDATPRNGGSGATLVLLKSSI